MTGQNTSNFDKAAHSDADALFAGPGDMRSPARSLDWAMVRIIPAHGNFATRVTRDRIEIDDLVQETLARGCAKLDKFQPGTRGEGDN